MSDGKARGWVIAAILLVAIPSLADPLPELAQQSDSYVGQNHSSTERQAKPEQQAKPEPKPTVADSLAKIARLLEAPEGRESAERGQRDLNAQEGMAKYAWWVAVIAFAQAFLTVVGIFLVWRTLVATRNATNAASKAAEAAEDAVLVTREIGEKQVRAYVTLAKASISDVRPKSEMTFNFTIMNGGQSPAIDLGNFLSVQIRPKGDSKCDIKPSQMRAQVFARSILPQGRAKDIADSIKIPIDQSMYDDIFSGDRILYVYAAIFYKDVFGAVRRSCYRMWLHPGRLKDGSAEFVFCSPDGARAT